MWKRRNYGERKVSSDRKGKCDERKRGKGCRRVGRERLKRVS
jgi:hypothetical protein